MVRGEIAVMEVGVRTRSQAMKRKVSEFAKLSSKKSSTLRERNADEDRMASCCSSEIADDHQPRFVDLEDNESNEAETSTHSCCRGREEMRKLREESDLGFSMPCESEIDEFFAAAEKDIRTRFAKKYNYDIAKDAPLEREGRYEWIRLKP